MLLAGKPAVLPAGKPALFLAGKPALLPAGKPALLLAGKAPAPTQRDVIVSYLIALLWAALLIRFARMC